MKKLTSFLCVIAAVGCAPLAHATLQLSYKIDGGATTTCASSPVETGPLTCSSITGFGVTITDFSAQTNASGGLAESHEFGSTLEIINSSGSTVDVTLWLAAQDFIRPTVPPGTIDYDSEVALTSTTGAGSVGLISCVDTSNELAPPKSPFCSAGSPSLTNVTQTYLGASSEKNTVSSTILFLDKPFSLSQEITLTLGRNSDLNVDTSQILTPTTPPPIPEPASIALLGGAMLFITAGGHLARRKRNRS
jgi:hypothetical protein